MRLKRLILLWILSMLGGLPAYSAVTIFPQSISPSGRYAVARVEDSQGRLYYAIVARSSLAPLATIISAEDAEGLRNVEFTASWNKTETLVALLNTYGRRLDAVRIFKREEDRFEEIVFTPPEPWKVWKNHYLVKTNTTGGDMDALGPWISDDTVSLVVALQRDKENSGSVIFLLTYEAEIRDSAANVINVKQVGALSDSEAADFFRKWGRQYILFDPWP